MFCLSCLRVARVRRLASATWYWYTLMSAMSCRAEWTHMIGATAERSLRRVRRAEERAYGGVADATGGLFCPLVGLFADKRVHALYNRSAIK